jgi:iron complex outermembrane recepter protein
MNKINQRVGLLEICVLLFGSMLNVADVRAATNILEASPAQLKKLSIEDLMEFEVTSVSRRSEPYQHAAAAIQVITQEEIRRSGASSIPEALRLANNLQVAQVDSRNWAISARGFNGTIANKLLVMIDGRTVYTPLFSGVFWDVQDYLLEDLERIEVISGPGATLFGANAVNGVINIISRNSRDTQGVLLAGGGGTELRAFGGVRYGGMLASNISYRVYGKYFDRDDSVFEHGSTNFAGRNGRDDWQMGQGGFRLDWDSSEQNLITFQGDLYNGRADQLRDDDITLSGGNFLGRLSHTFSDESDMSVQFYYDRTHREIPGVFSEDLDTYDLDLDHHFALGERNKFIWGLGYRFTHNVVENSSPLLSFLPEQLDRHLISAFIQDEIMLHEDLFLTLGTKLEHNEYTGFEVQPSARLSWNVATNHLIWSAVSRAVRTPSRIDRHLFAPITTNLFLAGGPDFDSESVVAYEIGYRVQLRPKISASVSTFFNDYDDLRSVRTNPPPAIIANDIEGETYGFELDTTYQVLDWWQLRAGYTMVKGDLREKSDRQDLNNARSETTDPEHQLSLQSLMNLPGNVEVDAHLRWVDRLPAVSNRSRDEVPSYFSLDLRVGWHPTENLELFLVGQNLLDEQHPEFGTGQNRHEIQRSVYGKVTWRF